MNDNYTILRKNQFLGVGFLMKFLVDTRGSLASQYHPPIRQTKPPLYVQSKEKMLIQFPPFVHLIFSPVFHTTLAPHATEIVGKKVATTKIS